MPNFLSPNPARDRIVIFDGVHGVSTKAVDLLFSDPSLLRDVLRQSAGHDKWQLLLKITEIDNSGKRPRAVKMNRRLIFGTVSFDESQIAKVAFPQR